MMAAMFAGPQEHGVLKCCRTENQCEKAHYPVGLESSMGEKPVIPDRDGKSAGKKHHEKEHGLEGVQAEKPEINGHRGDRQKQSADKKGADQPINFLEGDS